jgi:hypothetical protein
MDKDKALIRIAVAALALLVVVAGVLWSVTAKGQDCSRFVARQGDELVYLCEDGRYKRVPV